MMIGTRLSPEMKDRLEKAAERSGRSQAQEIEMRLEYSFNRQELLSDALTLAYSERLAAILLLVGDVMDHTGRAAAHWAMATRKHTGVPLRDIDEWCEHSFAYDQAVQAAVTVFLWARPTGMPAALARALASDALGISTALEMLWDLETGQRSDLGERAGQPGHKRKFKNGGPKLRAMLKSVLERKGRQATP